MEQKEIIEGSRLICSFMGGDPSTKGDFGYWKLPLNKGYTLNYHTDWNQLMPVVEKIEAFGLLIKIEGWETDLFRIGIVDKNFPWLQDVPYMSNHERGSKITACWKTVIQFIKWYNAESNSQ